MRSLLAIVLITVLAWPLGAQTEKLVETIEVRVTNVDVVVTDRRGNPVSGLTRQDFEIFEDGRPQRLTNFYEVRPKSVNVPVTAAVQSNPEVVLAESDEPPRELRQRRIVFFIDNYSLHPFKRNEVLSAINRFFEQLLQEGDEATIVVWNRGLQTIAPFSADMDILKSALDVYSRKNAGGTTLSSDRDRVKNRVQTLFEEAGSGRIPVQSAYGQALGVVRAYADEIYASERNLLEAMGAMISTLAGVDGKKVFVFAGAQLPERPAADMFHYVDQTFLPLMRNASMTFLSESSMRSIGPLLQKLAQQANADGVTMYMIDASDQSKMVSSDPESLESIDPTMEFLDFSNTASAFGSLARSTGGISLGRTNNFDLAMRTVARDLDAYYSLGYRPDDQVRNGARKITVKVKVPGLRVRSRLTYSTKTSDTQIGDRVVANIFHTSLKSEIPVRVQAGEPQQKDRNVYRVPMQITFPAAITLLPDGENLVGGFNVFLAVGNDNGGRSPVSKRAHPIRLPASAEQSWRQKPIVYTTEILVRKGESFLSVAIVDQITNTTGYARTKIVAR
jgi:VWFA-related protein